MVKIPKRHLMVALFTICSMTILIGYQNCGQPMNFTNIPQPVDLSAKYCSTIQHINFNLDPASGTPRCLACPTKTLDIDLGSGSVQLSSVMSQNLSTATPIISTTLNGQQIGSLSSILSKIQITQASENQFGLALCKPDPVTGASCDKVPVINPTPDHAYTLENGTQWRGWESQWMSTASPDMSEPQMIYATPSENQLFCWLANNIALLAAPENISAAYATLSAVIGRQWTDSSQPNYIDCRPLGDIASLHYSESAGFMACNGTCTTGRDLIMNLSSGDVQLTLSQNSSLGDLPTAKWKFSSSDISNLRYLLSRVQTEKVNLKGGPIMMDGENIRNEYFFSQASCDLSSAPSEKPYEVFEQSWLPPQSQGNFNLYQSGQDQLFCWMYAKLTSSATSTSTIDQSNLASEVGAVLGHNFTNPSAANYLNCHPLENISALNYSQSAGFMACNGTCTTSRNLSMNLDSGNVQLTLSKNVGTTLVANWEMGSSDISKLRQALSQVKVQSYSKGDDEPTMADGASGLHNYFFGQSTTNVSIDSEAPYSVIEQSWLPLQSPGIYNVYQSGQDQLYCWIYSELTSLTPNDGSTINKSNISLELAGLFGRNFNIPGTIDFENCSGSTAGSGTPPTPPVGLDVQELMRKPRPDQLKR